MEGLYRLVLRLEIIAVTMNRLEIGRFVPRYRVPCWLKTRVVSTSLAYPLVKTRLIIIVRGYQGQR